MTENKQKGIGLLEVIIAIAIIVGAVLASYLFFGVAIKLARQSLETVQASLLLEEGFEAVRVMRDDNWDSNISSLALDTTYYLHFDSNTWVSTTTPQVIDDKYTRTFTLSSVSRDSNDDVVTSGGTVDSDTKEVSFEITWQTASGSDKTVSAQSYITNAFEEE